MQNLFIIAGCNGAGKTTASFTVLPEFLGIKEFVNADEIARGLSPFQPESVAIDAGRIMLTRIKNLIENKISFAFETTLATRSFAGLINEAKQNNYKVYIIFYWLENAETAIERVRQRVVDGGHFIPEEVIKRRYIAGIRNFLLLYKDKADYWLLLDNSYKHPEWIAESKGNILSVFNTKKWNFINNLI